MWNQWRRLGLAIVAAGLIGPAARGVAQDNSDVDPLPQASPSVTDLQQSIEDRVIRRNRARANKLNIEDGDIFKKHPPVWSLKDVTKESHPYATPSSPAPGGGHYPGGPTGRFGQPYYYTPSSPDTSGMGGPGFGGPMLMGGFGVPGGPQLDLGDYPTAGGYSHLNGTMSGPTYVDPGLPGPGYGGMDYGIAGIGGMAYGAYPGGYGMGGSVAAQPGQLPGDPYSYHFGPGYYRSQEAGHYRFPYFSYRRPWYFPGHPSYNRDTNIPW